ncbi:hypothetical protein J2X20_002466 [Pelomonas saccharophila]|uniref:PEP-CTERM protein-sorting domain-containing protein n=1 Tax=Roseateles saccharophilus TaxID=304 RepID=A0ABU1YLV4_ROSSA|nr:PEP-CTERM sorting domain-containing protein [Roseateles saccharophilus]MDR7269837.1 hypothetical protein [Roseateles saccharophilus]
MYSRLFSSLFLVFGLAQAAHANLVVNGGFETGDFTGWTASIDDSWLRVCGPSTLSLCEAVGGFQATGGPHSGQYSAINGLMGLGGISQDLSTEAGKTYEVSFWLANCPDYAACAPNGFKVTWNGIELLALSQADPFAWTHYTFNVQASGTSSTLAFMGSNGGSFYMFDDVNVVGAGRALPEPASLALVVVGLGGLMAARRRAR